LHRVSFFKALFITIASLLKRKLSRAITNDHYIYNAISGIGRAVNKGVVGTFVGAAFEGTALSYLAVLL